MTDVIRDIKEEPKNLSNFLTILWHAYLYLCISRHVMCNKHKTDILKYLFTTQQHKYPKKTRINPWIYGI